MYNRKKRVRRLIVFGLSLIMLMATGLVVSASKQDVGTFSFNLGPYGDKQDSSVVPKYNNNPTARIVFETCVNPSQYPLYYRLRDGGTGAEASDLQTLHGTGVHLVPYKSGYGSYNSAYFIRIQTDSSSSYGATVSGYWEP